MEILRRHQYIIALLICFLIRYVQPAKVLLLPLDFGFNSRVINMAKMGQILRERGHDVTFISNAAIMKYFVPANLAVVEYALSPEVNYRLMTDSVVIEEMADLMKSPTGALRLTDFGTSVVIPFCRALLIDRNFMKRLKEENFDLMIVDIFSECGRILRDYLDVPVILYSNFGFTPTSDIFFPILTSFVCNPIAFVCNSDVMAFPQRVSNFLVQTLSNYVFAPYFLSKFQELREETGFNVSLSVLDSYREALVILNIDFVLDYPRPMMPNLIPIFGLYRTAPKPLPEDILRMVSDTNYDAVVVVSFGTLLPKIGTDKAEMMARVFARLPATVLWRFTGTPPRSTGSNTHLIGWFPQADVLAHPKTRLFITHCGISSTYETAQNGVPVVAMPMFLDQRYNAERLVGKAKIGVMVDFDTLTEEEFEAAIHEVLSNEKYLVNAKRVASLLTDQEIPARDKFIFWVEYVIKHGGAHHLISEAVPNLNMMQFYSVDVIAFLAVICMCFMVILCYTVRCMYRSVCGSRKTRKQKKG